MSTTTTPARWRPSTISGEGDVIREWPGGVRVGEATGTPSFAARVIRQRNCLIDVLDLAERGAPSFQIAEAIREILDQG